MIRFGSVCSGIEAASVACSTFGYGAEAAWFAEIEPAPSKLLAHHYPSVPNYGDMTLLPERILSGEIEAPDMLVGGTPCQAFSVAGKRLGLEDLRGNLTLTFIEVLNAIDSARHAIGLDAAVCCWENVVGVLSDKTGAFGCLMAGLAGFDEALSSENGKWGKSGLVIGPRRRVAWVTLDAQFFGVAQRRRRVWVVAIPTEAIERDPSRCPSKILSIGACLRRDAPSKREAGKTAPSTFGTSSSLPIEGTDRPSESNALGFYPQMKAESMCPAFELSPCLVNGTNPGFQNGICVYDNNKHGVAIYENHPMDNRVTGPHELSPTLHSRMGTGGGNVPLIMNAIGTDCYNGSITGDIACTMGTPGSSVNASGPTVMILNNDKKTFRMVAFGEYSDDDTGSAIKARGYKDATDLVLSDIAPSLTTNDHSRSSQASEVTQQTSAVFNATGFVRRLTPEECEILQGFPIGYTACMGTDGHRYKALGNSWAVPQAAWVIGRVIKTVFADCRYGFDSCSNSSMCESCLDGDSYE